MIVSKEILTVSLLFLFVMQFLYLV